MTFFDWSGSKGDGHVSSYLWIYIVVTAFFTAGTMGMWYFVVIYRRTTPIESDPESLVGNENGVMRYHIIEVREKVLKYWRTLSRACCGML
jgi:hypothetical protein